MTLIDRQREVKAIYLAPEFQQDAWNWKALLQPTSIRPWINVLNERPMITGKSMTKIYGCRCKNY